MLYVFVFYVFVCVCMYVAIYFTSSKMGMSESIFERLQTANSNVTLNLNYRMNKPITDLANALTYNGELLTADDKVASSRLNLPEFNVNIIFSVRFLL